MSGRTKKILIVLIVLFFLALAALLVLKFTEKKVEPLQPVPVKPIGALHEVIGSSVEKRPIDSYTYGTGDEHLVFVGGIHGGYEWNSVLLAYQFKDYLDANPSAIPAQIKVTVIPSLNPDAVFDVVGKEGRFAITDVITNETALAAARFNSNKVDLNRNFDCKWKPTATWRSKAVSPGPSAFSEPEAVALRDFVLKYKPDAVVLWHSQANNVYASECETGILPETLAIMNAYAKASGYGAVASFDAYEVNGDAEGWIAKQGIPALTVELKTHETVEWEQNLAGVKALFNYYSAQAK